MRTPAQMAREINDLNCHALAKSPVEKDGKTYDPSEVGYGPITVAQMEAIYAEARKIEWTDKKPDRAGWWAYKLTNGNAQAVEVYKLGSGRAWYAITALGGCDINSLSGQWSTRPIDMPEEARKELSK